MSEATTGVPAGRTPLADWPVFGGNADNTHYSTLSQIAIMLSALAIAPLQDLLNLGHEARMNVPGRAEGNWRWQLRPGELTPAPSGHWFVSVRSRRESMRAIKAVRDAIVLGETRGGFAAQFERAEQAQLEAERGPSDLRLATLASHPVSLT